MPYMKMVCRAGKTKEIMKYYTYSLRPRGKPRAPKVNKTTEQQKKINDRQLVRKLTRLLNANFDGTSWYITFSYKVENRPSDKAELYKHIAKLLRDLRKLYKKEKSVLKYIWTAEVGARGACHVHMVVNSMDTRKIKELWSYGWVTMRPMDSSGQYRRLAEYFVKYYQKTRGTDAKLQKKAYNPSRNLKRPIPKRTPMKGDRFNSDIKVPKGWYLDKDSLREGITEDGYEFLYYTIIKEGG